MLQAQQQGNRYLMDPEEPRDYNVGSPVKTSRRAQRMKNKISGRAVMAGEVKRLVGAVLGARCRRERQDQFESS
jgi:hypothetical protein